MSLRLFHSRFLLACALLAAVTLPALGQNYDPENEEMIPLSTMGTTEFFINLSSLELTDERQGQLDFDVIWYSRSQKEDGGYSRGRNRMNCLLGMYYRSPFMEEYDKNGRKLMSNFGGLPANYTSPGMFMRNDGLPLYHNLKDTCIEYSELDEGLMKW